MYIYLGNIVNSYLFSQESPCIVACLVHLQSYDLWLYCISPGFKRRIKMPTPMGYLHYYAQFSVWDISWWLSKSFNLSGSFLWIIIDLNTNIVHKPMLRVCVTSCWVCALWPHHAVTLTTHKLILMHCLMTKLLLIMRSLGAAMADRCIGPSGGMQAQGSLLVLCSLHFQYLLIHTTYWQALKGAIL
jgi:hypothetical protein